MDSGAFRMNVLLKDLPQIPLSAEHEQALFLTGGTEKLILHTLVPAVKYVNNTRQFEGCGPNYIRLPEVLSLCYAALSKAVKTFRPGMKRFLAYSKPFLRGELCRYWREKNVVRDAFRHEAPESDEFPKPLASESVEPAFEEIHWKELWTQVEPVIRNTLTPIEIKVLEFRYKFSYTLEAAGEEIGKSRERVRQIEKEALKKLRAALSSRGEL